jgi:hypothetical protein
MHDCATIGYGPPPAQNGGKTNCLSRAAIAGYKKAIGLS